MTQADVDAHYNNGLHIDWSNISMSAGHTRLTCYEFGDDPNDTSTNIQDLSGNGFHLNAKSGNGEIVQDAP